MGGCLRSLRAANKVDNLRREIVMINEAIKKLVCYGLENNLIAQEDIIFTTNQLLEILQIEEYEEPAGTYENVALEPVLKELLDYAYENGVLEENGVVYRDLFDTKLMAKLMADL